MTRPVPTRAVVQSELDVLRREALAFGGRVSVLALARRVGLANTTFRRHFPDITAEINAYERQYDAANRQGPAEASDTLVRLRQRNRDLEENLELATASIHRLTVENRRLRQELEARDGVVPIRRTPSTG